MNRYGKTYNIFKRDPDTHQLLPGVYYRPEIEYLSHCQWRFTEKIDGTNIRIQWERNFRTIVRGRSDKAQVNPELLENIITTVWAAELSAALDASKYDQVCIYGEGFGPGIQKVGQLYGPVKTFRAFDVWADGRFFTPEGTSWTLNELGVPAVPLVAIGPLDQGEGMVRKGLKSKFGDFYAEGLIARPAMGLYTSNGSRVQCKIKHRDLYAGSNE